MAIVSMTDAISGGVASSAEYNKLIDNILDLDARLGAVVSTSTAHARLNALESLTTNTSGVVGIGNQRLSDRLGAGITTSATADARFGSGVGTGSNVTTGSASSQLTDLRSRASALETKVNNAATLGSGNDAMNARIAALEASSGGVIPFFHGYSTVTQSITNAAYVPIALGAETVDTVNGHSTSTNNSRYTPGVLGWYECTGVILFAEGTAAYAANQVGGEFRMNGAHVTTCPLSGVFPVPDTSANITTSAVVKGMIQITNVTDYITLEAVSSYAGGISTVAGSNMIVRKVA